MQAEPSLRLVPVSREGLAFSVAAGLSTGGQNVPIGQRPRWQTRTRVRVLEDLRAELGIAP
jgi:hypothetical protein